MSNFVIVCSECGKKLQVPEKLAGKRVRCVYCQHVQAANPAPSQPAPAETSAKPSAIVTHCSHCGRRVRLKPELLGRKVRCPVCGETFAANVQTDSNSRGTPSPGPPPSSNPSAPSAPPPLPESPAGSNPFEIQIDVGSDPRRGRGGKGGRRTPPPPAAGPSQPPPPIAPDLGSPQPDSFSFQPDPPNEAPPPPSISPSTPSTPPTPPSTSPFDFAASDAPTAPAGPAGSADRLLSRSGKSKTMANRMLNGELKKLSGWSVASSEVYQVGEGRSLQDRLRDSLIVGFSQEKEIHTDLLQVFQLRSGQQELYVAVPFDNGVIGPCEFLMVVAGPLPESVGLLRGKGGKWGLDTIGVGSALLPAPMAKAIEMMGKQPDSQWVSPAGQADALARRLDGTSELKSDLRWDAKVVSGPMTSVYRLEWMAQALPLGDQHYLVVFQQIPRPKMTGMRLGLDFFLSWKGRFVRAVSASGVQSGSFGFAPFAGGNWLTVADEILGIEFE